MGQGSSKTRYSYGEDKVIRIVNGIQPQRYPGGIGTHFFNRMNQFKDNVAQIDAATGKHQTYSDLLQRSVRTALEMRRRGIKPGDIVTVCSHNHLDTVVPLLATFFLGAIPASLDPTLSLADITVLIKQVVPKMFFVSEEAVQLIEEVHQKLGLEAEVVVFGNTEKYVRFERFLEAKEGEGDFRPNEEVDDQETGCIFFSSGTTGLPKGICLTHYGLLNQMDYVSTVVDCKVLLAYSSLYWVSALGMIIFAISSGGARLIDRVFEPKKVWNYIEKYKISFAFLTVNASRDLCRVGRPDGIDTTSLDMFFTGGERVPPSLVKDLRELLPGSFVASGYGQTEVSGGVSLFNPHDEEDVELSKTKLDSSGRPLPTIDEYKIVDVETERTLGPNEPGELRLKSKYLMKGYYHLDTSTAYDSEGYFKTGDMVYYDEDFCLYVVDRIKEMLKYRSFHVAPAMLEEILLTHPAVSAAVVVGIPDEEDGEHPMACVILKQGAKAGEEEIRKYVDERVDDRKKLRGGVVIVKSFPTTATGKVNRRMVRNLHQRCG